MKNDTWVKPYFTKYKSLLLVIFFLGTMTVFCGGALMFTSGYTIDKSATHPYNILLIYVPVLLTRAFGIGRPVFRYLERLRSHNWVLKITSDLRTKLYSTLENDASYFNETHKTGEILGILADDIDHIQNLFLRTIFPTIIGYIVVILISIGLGWFNLWFGFLILLLLLIETVLVPLISVSVQEVRKFKQKQIKSKLYTELTDNVLGANDWIISGRKEDFKYLTSNSIKELNQSKNKTSNFSENRDLFLQIIFGLMVVSLLIFTNLTFTNNQEAANWVSAFALGLLPLSDSLIPVSQGFDEWPEYKNSITRLNSIKLVNKEKNIQNKIDLNNLSIKINDISFKYSNESSELISSFSQEIPAGSNLAIIGPSGSGKTTILQLLMGDLRPIKGSITINDIDVLSLQTQRSEIFSVLNQNPFLFNTSVMNNIRLGNQQASDTQVVDALKKVGMLNTIEKLPDKLNTLVEESGQRFSGGEKQRLALARIILQDTPIVILDEPTVGLDPITENNLLETLFDVLKDKTVIWVTHHLHNINYANTVVFLANSHIEMQGSPKYLFKTNKHFQDLYKMDQGL
ncbi:thiol reductant ABC exporter subunit CydC [Companilactobacillus sp. DQM5]|uniref:thiol reductant ABC exporter subunit CydC n=1 Tax=Companilactobacillus sp. DQM5 TaxID=3463359 RepID=UPI004059A24C